jgi:hypothetical protein
MNEFLRDLFNASVGREAGGLGEYEDEDLNNFFEAGKEQPKVVLMEMATQIFPNLDSQSTMSDICRRAGLTAKSAEKLLAYVKKNKAELQSLKNSEWVQDEERYAGMTWAVRSVFFSKKEEFKGQKKYAVLNIDINKPEGKEKLVLKCSKESVQRISDKLAKLDQEIRALFSAGQPTE